MAIMLITHAMGVVAETAQRVVVMYAGKVVEEAPVERAVRQAAPSLHPGPDPLDPAHRPRRRARPGWRRSPASVPSLIDPPPGCRFAPRCQFVAMTACTDGDAAACARSRRATRSPACCEPSRRRATARCHDRAAAARQRSGQALPGQAAAFCRATVEQRACRRRRQLRHRRRRDPGPGRRIRLRQVDHRALHPAADRADLGRGLVRGHGRHRARQRRPARAAPRHADHLPGPLRLARTRA